MVHLVASGMFERMVVTAVTLLIRPAGCPVTWYTDIQDSVKLHNMTLSVIWSQIVTCVHCARGSMNSSTSECSICFECER